MPKLTEDQIQELLKTDPKAIHFRERIKETRPLLGDVGVKFLEIEYEKYINTTYRKKK